MTNSEFERDHPRDRSGRFADKPGAGSASEADVDLSGDTFDPMQPRDYSCPGCATNERLRRMYPGDKRFDTCDVCGGSGVATVDPERIRAALTNSRTGRFRTSRPKRISEGGQWGAYYTWRMIRFDSGQDMTMPVMAPYDDSLHGSDANTRQIKGHLDQLVDQLGADFFGRVGMMRGAARWGKALGLPGADEVHDAVDRAVGVPSGAGSDVGGFEDSPEFAVDNMLDDADSYDLHDKHF